MKLGASNCLICNLALTKFKYFPEKQWPDNRLEFDFILIYLR